MALDLTKKISKIIVTGDTSGSVEITSNNVTLNQTVIHSAEADKWTTPRTITLAGDVSGSATIDGSTDITLTQTVTHSAEADKWTTPRTLSLTGTITGSAIIDGTTDLSINTYGLTRTLLVGDDTLVQTTTTTPSAVKSFRLSNMNNQIDSLEFYLSAWNATSTAVTTIFVDINGTATQSATTSATTETMMSITGLSIPTGSGINTVTIYLQTSNASYAAYQQLTEILGK